MELQKIGLLEYKCKMLTTYDALMGLEDVCINVSMQNMFDYVSQMLGTGYVVEVEYGEEHGYESGNVNKNTVDVFVTSDGRKFCERLNSCKSVFNDLGIMGMILSKEELNEYHEDKKLMKIYPMVEQISEDLSGLIKDVFSEDDEVFGTEYSYCNVIALSGNNMDTNSMLDGDYLNWKNKIKKINEILGVEK